MAKNDTKKIKVISKKNTGNILFYVYCYLVFGAFGLYFILNILEMITIHLWIIKNIPINESYVLMMKKWSGGLFKLGLELLPILGFIKIKSKGSSDT